MTKQTRLKISFVFFLVVGMLGIANQLYKYFIGNLELTFSEGALTVFFGMFIFKPMLLLDLFDDIRIKFLGAKSRVFKMNTGGETPIEDDEEADA
tara:strand:+ start:24651 stop:24935 length:285 start_codon:yes stop_codon:yes gene_type:complete